MTLSSVSPTWTSHFAAVERFADSASRIVRRSLALASHTRPVRFVISLRCDVRVQLSSPSYSVAIIRSLGSQLVGREYVQIRVPQRREELAGQVVKMLITSGVRPTAT